MQRCMGCMAEFADGIEICPVCEYDNSSLVTESFHLAPATILEGRYIVGRTLGFGGFGVTYIGYDAQLDRKVAIKEYLPSDFSTRAFPETSLTVFPGELAEQFEAGLRSFIDEARHLAHFSYVPGIVSIFDSFAANNTGYIVMEYLEGMTVKEALKNQGIYGFQEALAIILPLCDALEIVHDSGIIHRDIAPDNIFLTNDGEVKLIDFGASRHATTLFSKSLSVILKPGYSPEEQYRSRGVQGSYSDVYALAATLYKMITGTTPEEAMDRKLIDELKAPSRLGSDIPKSAENALLNALNVDATSRTQTALEFKTGLTADGVARIKIKQKRPDSGKVPAWLRVFSPIVISAACILVVLFGTGVINLTPGGFLPSSLASALGIGQVNAPSVVNMDIEKARLLSEDAGLNLVTVSEEYSDTAPEGRIISQEPLSGQVVESGTDLLVVISLGRLTVPDVTGMTQADAGSTLSALGMPYQTSEEESAEVPMGSVISQSLPKGTFWENGLEVSLVISKGRWVPEVGHYETITHPGTVYCGLCGEPHPYLQEMAQPWTEQKYVVDVPGHYE